MQRTLTLQGWTPGLKKVSTTRVIHTHTELGLAEAKSCTDRLLEGETVHLPAQEAEEAEQLATDLRALGVLVEVSDSQPPPVPQR